jgi:hypothetical protein
MCAGAQERKGLEDGGSGLRLFYGIGVIREKPQMADNWKLHQEMREIKSLIINRIGAIRVPSRECFVERGQGKPKLMLG